MIGKPNRHSIYPSLQSIHLVHWATVTVVAVIIGVYAGCGRSPANLSAEDRWKQHYDAVDVAREANLPAEAEREARLALNAAESFPTTDLRRVRALNELAQACQLQGKHQEAEAFYRKALALCRQNPAENWFLEANILTALAVLYGEKDQNPAAQRTIAQAREIHDAHLAPDDPMRVPELEAEATIAFKSNQLAKARSLAYRLLEITQANGIRDNESTGSNLKMIAMAYAKESQYAKAASVMEKAIPVIAATEPDSANLATAYGMLGKIHTLLGHRDKAIPLYQKAIAMGRELPDLSSTDLALMLQDYAVLLEKTHRSKEAAALRKEAKAILARKKDQVDRS